MANRNHKISVACAIKFEDEILIISEKQKGQIYIDMPAGGVEHGETLDEAVIREIKEETNLEVGQPTLVGIFEYIESEKTTINFLYMIDLKEKPELTKVNDEDVIGIEWKKIDTIKNMLSNDQSKFEHPLAIARLEYIFKSETSIQNINYIRSN